MNKSQEKLVNKATNLRNKYHDKMSKLMESVQLRVESSKDDMDRLNDETLEYIKRISK